jgi:hypothetical protein
MKRKTVDPVSKVISLWRGLYGRVASNVGCDPSYVSRVARGERRSAVIEAALSKEFREVSAKLKSTFGPLKKTRSGGNVTKVQKKYGR